MWKTTRRGGRVSGSLAILPLLAGWAFSLACGSWAPSLLMIAGSSGLAEFSDMDVQLELERFQPSTPGMLVPLPVAECAFVPATQDDGRDRASALGVSPEDEVVQSYLDAATLQDLPEGLPQEFMLYAAHRLSNKPVVVLRGETPVSVDPLRELLALPPQERCWRSVWAAFRLGRMIQEDHPEEAIGWFRKVRELAAEGFADSLGMAEASVGWEARAAMDAGRFVDAIHLYLEDWALGRDTRMSLMIVSDEVMHAPFELLLPVAADPVAAGVVTACLNGSGRAREAWMSDEAWVREDVVGPWIRALEQAGTLEDIGLHRAALRAYRRGDFERAERWACLAPREPLAVWVRAKLAVRRGDLDEAARHYAELSCLGDPGALWDWRAVDRDGSGMQIRSIPLIQGEHAVVLMSQDRYAEALEMLVQGCFWPDAAYVAERVMKLEDLQPVVDRVAPPETAMASFSTHFTERLDPAICRSDLRYLLARRLAREGRWEDAAAYMPPSLQTASRELGRLLRECEDASLPDRARALAMWEAARRLRSRGMELVATELWPDQHIDRGQHAGDDPLEMRIDEPPATGVLPTRRELEQAQASLPTPLQRYHYRYQAADLAWRAAALLPDQELLTSEVLWRAGRWLAARDPKAADRFYKALVRRCGETPLGAAAKRARWFPQPTLRANDRKQS